MKKHFWNLVNLDQDQGTNISAFDEEANARVIERCGSGQVTNTMKTKCKYKVLAIILISNEDDLIPYVANMEDPKHVGRFCKNRLRFTMQFIVSISSTSSYPLGWRKQLQ